MTRQKYTRKNEELAAMVREVLRDGHKAHLSLNEAVQVALTQWLTDRAKEARR